MVCGREKINAHINQIVIKGSPGGEERMKY
jgi:hypothetical protein